MAKYWDIPEYAQPTREQIREKARRTTAKAAEKGREMRPVAIAAPGDEIATSWWGKAWCDNLGRYADYENRLERGRAYARSGGVVDLHISRGLVEARVQGARTVPYKVKIRVSPLSEKRIQKLVKACGNRIGDMQALASGSFPDELKEAFLSPEGGMLPSAAEISLDCTCPDWAIMCKHVAAALYAVGAKLDEDPLLLFTLRAVDPGKLVDTAVSSRIENMLANADRPTRRAMQREDWGALFGF